MGKSNVFDKNNTTIIDTVKYNGRYTDVSTVRTRILAVGAVLVFVAAFVGLQLLL